MRRRCFVCDSFLGDDDRPPSSARSDAYFLGPHHVHVVVVVVVVRRAGGDDASGVAVLDMAVVARAFNAFLPNQTSAVLSPDAVQYVALGAGKDNRPIERGNDFVITPVLHAGIASVSVSGTDGPHFPSCPLAASHAAPVAPVTAPSSHYPLPAWFKRPPPAVCVSSSCMLCFADTDTYDHLMVYNVRSGAVNSVNVSNVSKVTRLPI